MDLNHRINTVGGNKKSMRIDCMSKNLHLRNKQLLYRCHKDQMDLTGMTISYIHSWNFSSSTNKLAKHCPTERLKMAAKKASEHSSKYVREWYLFLFTLECVIRNIENYFFILKSAFHIYPRFDSFQTLPGKQKLQITPFFECCILNVLYEAFAISLFITLMLQIWIKLRSLWMFAKVAFPKLSVS